MLVLLPPSEGKTAPRRGKPLAMDALSWPELTPARDRVVDALVDLASGDAERARDALGISERMQPELDHDRRLRTAPTVAAARLYSGVLYDALDLKSLDPAARRWAQRNVVIVSALFGALRLNDRVPAYRLGICTRLLPEETLQAHWRPHLAAVLEARARRGLVVDLRSGDYAALWRPTGPVAARTIAVHVRRDGKVVSHDAKHTRGLVARRLAVAGAEPRTVEQLHDVLAPAFDVDLERTSTGWRMDVLL